MQTIHFTDLVHRFSKVPIKELKLLTPIQMLQSLIVESSQQPENLKDTFYDPNEFYIHGKPKVEKKYTNKEHKEYNTKQFVLGKKAEKIEEKKQKKQVKQPEIQSPHEQKKRIYRPGPFALFYQLNENKIDKDEQVWYYKENKEIIGPVSSYNMDKMAYYKNVEDETKVAYKSVQKFVKFSKIKKVVESNKKQTVEEPISSQQSQ